MCPYCQMTTGLQHQMHCPMRRYVEYERLPQSAWECPRCNRINAPWVEYCKCSERVVYYAGNSTDNFIVTAGED